MLLPEFGTTPLPVVEPEKSFEFPPLDFLTPANEADEPKFEESKAKDELERLFAMFRIKAEVTDVYFSPGGIMYEVVVALGTRLNTLRRLEGDIAFSLGYSSVSINPIPGKAATIGIMAYHLKPKTVSLRTLIELGEETYKPGELSVALGLDANNRPITCEITQMPHLLVSGTTGSGKSTFLRSLIINLIYRYTPKELRFVIIGSSESEYVFFDGIPHLLHPSIGQVGVAVKALQWLENEITRRYSAFFACSVRDIDRYNEQLDINAIMGYCDGEKMPRIVVVLDGLSELMRESPETTEYSICRIGQNGRAVGIHLIIAEQSQCVSAITERMSANLLSRLTFKTLSEKESSIALNQEKTSAEQLATFGDALYLSTGQDKPIRIVTPLVTSNDVLSVARYYINTYGCDYNRSLYSYLLEDLEKSVNSPGFEKSETDTTDPYFEIAVDIAFDHGQINTSLLQRRLKLGYARVARIMDQMEEQGIIGPYIGAQPRKILISKEEWKEKKNKP